MPVIAAWLLWACAGPPGCGEDPALAPFVEAAEAWDRGRAAMARGDTEAALAAFAEAEAKDPQSPVLPAWRARALEAGGRDAEAEAVLDEALGRFPEDVDLRWNRAALRARRGELDGAAADVLLLRAAEGVDPAALARDPDLAVLRDRPETAALFPVPRVKLQLHGEEGSVLLGERYDLQLDLLVPADTADLALRAMGEPTGLLRRVRVVEDRLLEQDGEAVLRLDLELRAVAPGRAMAGPWLLVGGGASALSERLEVEVVAVGARAATADPGPEDPLLPSALLAGHTPPWAGRVEGRLVLLGPPGASFEVQDAGGAPVAPEETWERRTQGQPTWVAQVYPDPGAARVILRAGGAVLLDERR